jgi:DNA-binding NtrC family response regulator
LRQINVLIADDDKTFCDIFGRVVSLAGYNRYSAYSSEQCISILDSTPIDILFLDLRFPSINDGYKVLEYCHENHHGVEIIMLSLSDSIMDVVQTLKSGAADFIEKSIYTEQLYEVLLTKIKHIEKQITLEDKNKDLAVKAIRMVGSSPVMQVVYDNIALAAQFDSPVLITGETGVGKELVAKAIHKLSKYSGKNLITVNCGAIPHELVESELFGCEQGAFTGALKARKGYFEYADGSTILLDEISELPFQVQATLLRILSEGEMQKLGGKMQKVNCRIICTFQGRFVLPHQYNPH